jgi:hypothetical protein
MFSYRFCGHTFHSNVPIQELDPGSDQQPEFTFQLSADRKFYPETLHWLNHWYSLDGSVWLSIAKLEAAYLLHFPRYADFVISPNGRTIRCYSRTNRPAETMRHLLLNQVIPLVFSHLGKLVLHASACVMPQGVIAFMGMTGAGKSTLAASFGLRGFPIISDDCLLVEERAEETVTTHSYPGLRLWPETVTALFEQKPVLQPLAHYTDKKRVLFDQDHFDRPLSLIAIYVLAQPENMSEINDVTITPLTVKEALLEIIKHTFQLDITDREKLAQAFKQYEWLAKSVAFFRLTYPRDHAYLSTVNRSILNHLNINQDWHFQNSE